MCRAFFCRFLFSFSWTECVFYGLCPPDWLFLWIETVFCQLCPPDWLFLWIEAGVSLGSGCFAEKAEREYEFSSGCGCFAEKSVVNRCEVGYVCGFEVFCRQNFTRSKEGVTQKHIFRTERGRVKCILIQF